MSPNESQRIARRLSVTPSELQRYTTLLDLNRVKIEKCATSFPGGCGRTVHFSRRMHRVTHSICCLGICLNFALLFASETNFVNFAWKIAVI